MIDGVPPAANAGEDRGEDRDTHVKPCAKHPWCVREVGHDGKCHMFARASYPPPDFGPNRIKKGRP